MTKGDETMRKIKLSNLPQEVVDKILEEDPLSEDIGIFDKAGNLVSAIIKPKAYKYFLMKVEEDEEAIDKEELKNFDSEKENSSLTKLDDLMKEY